jgi:actin-related protein
MQDLVEWIKANVKDDADINEATKLIDSYAEVTPERAAELAKDKEVRRIIDAEISRAVERHDERFNEEKLPKLLDSEREKIRKELNPEEDPRDKQMREIREEMERMKAEKQTIERREQLRKKAQELGVDEIGLSPDDVDPFVRLGDDGGDYFEAFVNKAKEAWTSTLDKRLKEKFSGGKPEADPEPEGGDGPHGEDYVKSRLEGTFLG